MFRNQLDILKLPPCRLKIFIYRSWHFQEPIDLLMYNMHGNVKEWVQDLYGDYPSNSVVDPKGPDKGDEHVMRGGSWINYAVNIRSAYRFSEFSLPEFRIFNYGGFRVAQDF